MPEGESRRLKPIVEAPGEPPPPDLLGGSSPDDEDVTLALDVLRKMADQEFNRAERAASRARQAFALAAGFFAVVQTVAFGSFAKSLVSHGERTTLLWLAGGAGVFLAICGVILLRADASFRSFNISTDK